MQEQTALGLQTYENQPTKAHVKEIRQPVTIKSLLNIVSPLENVDEGIYHMWAVPTYDGWEILPTPKKLMEYMAKNNPCSFILCSIPKDIYDTLESRLKLPKEADMYFDDCYATNLKDQ